MKVDQLSLLKNLYEVHVDVITEKVISELTLSTNRGCIVFTYESPLNNTWEALCVQFQLNYLDNIDSYKTLIWNYINDELRKQPTAVQELFEYHKPKNTTSEFENYEEIANRIICIAVDFKNDSIIQYLNSINH